MQSIPQIQIRQQAAKIGLQGGLGSYEIRQPKPELEMTTTPPSVSIEQPQGELLIDQRRAWNALGQGNYFDFMNNIYSQAKEIALQGIAKIVENGNRLADIKDGGNPIADIAQEQAFAPSEMDYYPNEPSIANVSINYRARPPVITPHEGHVDIRFTPHKPDIAYHPAGLQIYLAQYPGVEIIPPQLDIKV